MAEESEWSRRLGEAMAGTLQEQLRSLVHEAQEGLKTFAEAAIEQSSVLGDAHKRLIAAQHQFEAGIRDVRADLARGFEEVAQATAADRERIAAVRDELAGRFADLASGQHEALGRIAD